MRKSQDRWPQTTKSPLRIREPSKRGISIKFETPWTREQNPFPSRLCDLHPSCARHCFRKRAGAAGARHTKDRSHPAGGFEPHCFDRVLSRFRWPSPQIPERLVRDARIEQRRRVPPEQPVGLGKTAQQRGTAGAWHVSPFRGQRCCRYGRKSSQSWLPYCPGAKEI